MLYLRQNDPKWASKPIGKTNISVGRMGCTLTSLSMLSSYYGCYKSPAELAAIPWLFTRDAKIIWANLSKVFAGKIKWQIRRYGMNRQAITASFAGGPKTSVMCEVANKSHWVVIVGVYGNDYWCVDPIDGKRKLLLKTYGNITGSSHLTN